MTTVHNSLRVALSLASGLPLGFTSLLRYNVVWRCGEIEYFRYGLHRDFTAFIKRDSLSLIGGLLPDIIAAVSLLVSTWHTI